MTENDSSPAPVVFDALPYKDRLSHLGRRYAEQPNPRIPWSDVVFAPRPEFEQNEAAYPADLVALAEGGCTTDIGYNAACGDPAHAILNPDVYCEEHYTSLMRMLATARETACSVCGDEDHPVAEHSSPLDAIPQHWGPEDR